MEFIQWCLGLVLHMDEHLKAVIEYCGVWTYAVLFAIIFCETGLVVTPILPGDSLLFAAGAMSALAPDTLRIEVLLVVLMVAAIVGDTVNYWIGRWVGPRAFSGKFRFFKQEHLVYAQKFYAKHGGKTIILARFMPIIRTFAPFVAGIGVMNYSQFILYNIVGGVAWVGSCTLLGYWFGNIAWVKENFEIVVVAIVLASVIPLALQMLFEKRRRPPEAQE